MLLVAELFGSGRGRYIYGCCMHAGSININACTRSNILYTCSIDIATYIVRIKVTKMALYKVVSFMLVIVMVVLKAQGLSDVEAIEAVARRYETSLAEGDIDAVVNLYAEDARIFTDDALPTGREGN